MKHDMGNINETITINLPDHTSGTAVEVHNFVLGKQWNWTQETTNNLRFISSKAEFNFIFQPE